MLTKRVERRQPCRCSKFCDPLPLHEKHSIGQHDNGLDAIVSQRVKCRVKAFGAVDLGGNHGNAELPRCAFRLPPIDNDAARNVDQHPDPGCAGDQLNPEFQLFPSQTFEAEQHSGYVAAGP